MSNTPPFTIGTLSFERCDLAMALPPKERVRLIATAVEAYQPDLLVTAGYAVHTRHHLDQVVALLANSINRTTVITEVHYDGKRRRSLGRQHAMWAIFPDGELHRFGRQSFATMDEARDPDHKGLGRFRRNLERRTVQLDDRTVFALCCGELNIVGGRNKPAFIDPECEAAITAADIIVNPTHDRMGNAGTLHAKRSLLSAPLGRKHPRIYVSCSNWNTDTANGAQAPSPTLHTVYVDGAPIEGEEYQDGAFGLVYRHWEVPPRGDAG